MVIKGNRRQAEDQAQANANYFNSPFIVFRDASGELRVEPEQDTRLYDAVVFHPSSRQHVCGAHDFGQSVNDVCEACQQLTKEVKP